MSISWQSGVKPRPALLVLPPGVDSLEEADAAIEMWEFYSRKRLDSSQRLTVQVMMAESGGRWAARTTGREMPRQNGKGDEIEVVEFWGIVQRAEAILHTAHELKTVSSAHQRMVGLIEGHPDMRRRKRKVLNGIGQQLIELKNGGVIAYCTRTNGGGRGLDDISRLVVDEAQHAKPEQLASSTPILMANPNPQTNFAGTGGIAGVSDWWWQLRKRALGKNPGPFGYVGHTAETVTLRDDGVVVQSPVDASDRKQWRGPNPALIAGRADMEFLEEQYRTLGPVLFAREHLGVWDPPEVFDVQPVKLPVDKWSATGVQRDVALRWQARSIAFDADRDGRSCSIAVAGGSLAGDSYVEVTRFDKGAGWLPGAVVEMMLAYPDLPVGCNNSGATGAQVGAVLEVMAEAGIPADRVRLLNSSDLKQACGGFYTAVDEGRLHRPQDGQPDLDRAAGDAGERVLAGGFAWAQRNATIPLSPLNAVTVARHLLPYEAVQPSTESAYGAERGMAVLG